MEKFEIFKLKEAGLSNEQVLRVLDYCRKEQALTKLRRDSKDRSLSQYHSFCRQLPTTR